MYEISEISIIYAVFVYQLAFVSKKNGGNRRSFVVEEGPPPICGKVQQQQQCACAYLETGSA